MKNKKIIDRTGDLPDSEDDRKRLEPENTTIDLPEVKDIPGQEHVRPPKLKEFADTTISSADEEGEGVLDPLDEEIEDTDVSPEELELLERTEYSQAGPEDLSWENARLNNTDEDGEALNEENEFSGKDLDIPGAEDDDKNEEIGEEDEENNSYSLGGDRKDD